MYAYHVATTMDNCITLLILLFTDGEVTIGFTTGTLYITEGQTSQITVKSTVVEGEDPFDPPSLTVTILSVTGSACKFTLLRMSILLEMSFNV